MKLSTIVATLSSERKLFRVEDDEPFMQTSLDFEKYTVPLVCSEYLLQKITGKVSVIGYFIGENVDGRLFTYFYAEDLSPVDESTPVSNSVDIQVKLTTVGKFDLYGRKARVSMKLVGKYICHGGKTSVIHMKAIGSAARKLKSSVAGQVITCSGYISPKVGPIEIIVTKADYCSKGGDNNVG